MHLQAYPHLPYYYTWIPMSALCVQVFIYCVHPLSLFKMSKKDSLNSFATHIPLMDIERYVFHPLCSLNLMELSENVLAGQIDSLIYSAVVKLGLFSIIIPHTYVYPKFITCLYSSMYPHKCFVMNSVRENIFQASTLLIHQALDFPTSKHYIDFIEETLEENFQICLLETIRNYLFTLCLQDNFYLLN